MMIKMKIDFKDNLDNFLIGALILFLINEGGEDTSTLLALGLLFLA